MIVRFEGKVQINIDEGTCPRCKHLSHPADVDAIIAAAAEGIVNGLIADPQAAGIRYIDADGFPLVPDDKTVEIVTLYDVDDSNGGHAYNGIPE